MAADFSAANAGSVIVGYDSRSCNVGIDGAIRYNSSISSLQVCTQSTGNCPNIGDSCDDGTIYAGTSPDGTVRMYAAPADAGLFTWNDGSTTWVNTAIVDCNGPSGPMASCRTGFDNTSLLEGLSSGGSPAPYDAAQHCADLAPPDADALGHNDWYLPSLDEMLVLYNNRDEGDLSGTFTMTGWPNSYYWTSSEGSDQNALNYQFQNDTHGFLQKSEQQSVRCVRKGGIVAYGWTNL